MENELIDERVDALYSIVKMIGESKNLNELLIAILDAAISIMNCERGFIMFLESTGELVVKASKNINGTELQDCVNISRSITRDAILNKKGILTHNAMQDPRYSKNASVINFGLRSVIAVPMILKENVIGAIYLDNRFKKGVFRDEDLVFMKIFAHEVAFAMEKVMLEDEKAFIYNILSTHMDMDVARSVVESGYDSELRCSEQKAAVMFLDIRGFTPLSEKYPPKILLPLLNEFFRMMSNIILDYHGVLLKFLGDGFMASWGVPIADPDCREQAIRAAMKMLQASYRLNESRVQFNEPQFNIGIGLHFGVVQAGIIGCPIRCEYSIMGDVVNTASRLQELCKKYKTPIIASEEILQDSSMYSNFKPIGKASLKGKTKSVRIYMLKHSI